MLLLVLGASTVQCFTSGRRHQFEPVRVRGKSTYGSLVGYSSPDRHLQPQTSTVCVRPGGASSWVQHRLNLLPEPGASTYIESKSCATLWGISCVRSRATRANGKRLCATAHLLFFSFLRRHNPCRCRPTCSCKALCYGHLRSSPFNPFDAKYVCMYANMMHNHPNEPNEIIRNMHTRPLPFACMAH